MSSTNVQVCSICVMDANTPRIAFEPETGQCNCCKPAFARRPFEWWPGAEGQRRMDDLVARLRKEGEGKPYDCMVGLSGGIDSAYLAHLMGDVYKLRLFAVHVDGGWNSAAAVANIEALVRKLDLDLFTQVIEWSEMRDLQVAFLKSGVYNQDFPQDHAFFATLFKTARQYGIRTFLSGVNYSSECVNAPQGGSVTAYDGKHLRAIHKLFGKEKLKTFPSMTLLDHIINTRVRKRPIVEKPLNFINYDKSEATEVLRQNYGWRDYVSKHSESRFTKFYQDIYLPRKHHTDKRRVHLSSLIVSDQMTREDALEELSHLPIDGRQAARDLKFVAKKLGMAVDELDSLLDQPPVSHLAYPSDTRFHTMLMQTRASWQSSRKRANEHAAAQQ